ncbi:Cyclin-U1-1-like protein [Drosera capensis]
MLAAGGQDSATRQPDLSDQYTPTVLVALALVLEHLVSKNDRLIDNIGVAAPNNGHVVGEAGQLGKNLKVFHGVRAPSISIPKYLERIYKYTKCSPSCFVVGYVYIDRLVHRYPELLVVSLNVHRLLVTSVMVASKMLDDEHYNNEFYARVGGVSNAELNRLEVELLFMLDFGITVSSSVFETYCFHLEKEMKRINIEKPLPLSPTSNLLLFDVDEIAADDVT